MRKKIKCWEVFKCNEKECPAYKSKDLKCWLFSGTHCRNEIQGKFLEKMELCLGCEVFKANMDVSAMKDTVEVIDKQFKEFTSMVEERDKELEDTGLELSVGLSEVLEALNKIASGDPRVRIPEESKYELIAKLKQTVNKTAGEIGTIVDQSHEFAIGLAEHFDILNKVSKGELDVRIPESSKDELLKALVRVTNQMIESVAREITERKQAEARIHRQNAVVNAINKVFQETLVCKSVQDLARMCLAVAEELTSSKFGFVGEVNEAGRFDTIALSDPGWNACRIPKSNAVVIIKDMEIRGIWGQVIKNEKSLIVNDPSSDPNRVGIPENHPPLSSFLGVPLKYAGRTIGIIALANKESGYTPDNQEAVETLSVAFVEALMRKRAEETLREKEEREALMLSSLPMAFYTAQPSDGFSWIWVSKQIEQISGFPANKYTGERHFWASRLHPDDREQVLKELETIYKKGTLATEYRWQCADGEYCWFRDQAVLIRGEKGEPKEIIGTWRDITDRKKAEEELQQVNKKLTDWMKELEQRNREVELLSKMGGMLQTCLTAEETYSVIAQSAKQLFDTESGALYMFSFSRNVLEEVAMWGESLASEHVFIPNDCWALRRGQVHMMEDVSSGMLCRHLIHPAPVSYMCVPMMAHGETLGILHLQSNIKGLDQTKGLTESKQRLAVTMAEQIAMALANLRLQETLRIQSIRDPLTGMFNRRYMEESLEREVLRSNRKQCQLGVIMIDLDHFKQFNDNFGHAAGDAMLREFGNFLKTSIRGEDIACRYGGEEFTLILPETSLESIQMRAEQLRVMSKRLNVQYLGRSLGSITISIGISIFPDHGSTSEALLQAADAALYQAKESGRDQVVVLQVKE